MILQWCTAVVVTTFVIAALVLVLLWGDFITGIVFSLGTLACILLLKERSNP